MTRKTFSEGVKGRIAALSCILALVGAGAASAQEYYYDDGATYVTDESYAPAPSVTTTLPGKPTTLYNLDGSVYAQGYTTSDGQLIYDRGGVSQTVPSTSSAPTYYDSGSVVYDTGTTYYDPGAVVVDSSPMVVYESSPTIVYESYYDSSPSWGGVGFGWGWDSGYWGRDRYRPYYRPHYRPDHRPGYRPRPPGGKYPPHPGGVRPPKPPRPGSGYNPVPRPTPRPPRVSSGSSRGSSRGGSYTGSRGGSRGGSRRLPRGR